MHAEICVKPHVPCHGGINHNPLSLRFELLEALRAVQRRNASNQLAQLLELSLDNSGGVRWPSRTGARLGDFASGPLSLLMPRGLRWSGDAHVRFENQAIWLLARLQKARVLAPSARLAWLFRATPVTCLWTAGPSTGNENSSLIGLRFYLVIQFPSLE